MGGFTAHTYSQTMHKVLYSNGNVEEQGQFDKSGKQTGEWKYFYENGQVKRIEYFIENKIFAKSFWENGKFGDEN